MKNNKGFAPIAIVLIIVAVLVFGGVAYYARQSLNNSPQYKAICTLGPTECSDGSYVSAGPNCEPGKCLFGPKISTSPKISTTLPTPYISAQSGWPPIIKDSGEAYSCVPGSYKPISIHSTTKDGKEYCAKTESDATTGSIYRIYTYTTANGNGTKMTNFTLRYQSCGAYPDSALAQCENAQANFNLDAIVVSLMQ